MATSADDDGGDIGQHGIEFGQGGMALFVQAPLVVAHPNHPVRAIATVGSHLERVAQLGKRCHLPQRQARFTAAHIRQKVLMTIHKSRQ